MELQIITHYVQIAVHAHANPRCTRAARVTVVVSGFSHLLCSILLQTSTRNVWDMKMKMYCGDFSETAAFESYGTEHE